MFGQWSRPFSILANGNCLANTSKIEKYSENDFGKSILFDPVVKKEYIVGTNSIEDINPAIIDAMLNINNFFNIVFTLLSLDRIIKKIKYMTRKKHSIIAI